ncbi:pyridoxal-dependent decarboxylase, exosortase A system-associated [Sphingomonas gilva]|uniref:Pyridoxal-dependent decarboxylase, exosortase A system-associated n=1 Tax=Sphingomonas gilva TaxID=2305907 RepID=A0A396RLG3_9SPHN|nr:pyridoxal-dependent decarboxylase, exosortase A system-associated [Sphingomonas gilva]RHW17150.1 pyridoxal-dependent decarboxylase, exosortase A system-associated [Sphingomonas gilva]
MKPMGAVPADYRWDGGKLLIGGQTAEALIARAGDTPLFVYDMAIVRDRIARFRDAMPAELALHYAIKANPHPDLLAATAPLVDGLDVASAGEMAMALAVMAPERISFAGPGKRDDELEAAIRAGVTLNLESPAEGRRALVIGKRLGVRPQLAIRVNPDFELRGSGMRMGGRASPFGMDAAEVAPLVAEIDAGAGDWRGLHIFAGSQALDAGAIVETQAQTLALARRLAEAVGRPAPLVNLGGGFGIPYFPGEQPVDLAAVGAALKDTLPSSPRTAFAIELGRWLVGEAGVYLTRILDKKVSNGETFLITDGGLHHQLAASGNFGTVVRRNYPLALASGMGDETEVVNVVGCLCTPLDRLGDRVELPRAEVNDVIAIFMAGAYGVTASPSAFLGHVPARERVLD